jgi:hypothetical protein
VLCTNMAHVSEARHGAPTVLDMGHHFVEMTAMSICGRGVTVVDICGWGRAYEGLLKSLKWMG